MRKRKPKGKRPKYRKIDRYLWPIIAIPIRGPYFLLKKPIAKLLKLKKGDVVLETHSGSIPHYKMWQGIVGKEGKVIATDLDPAVVRRQRLLERTLLYRRKKNRTDIRVADAERLPFADATFSKTITIYSDKTTKAALEELHRVLKPNGLALIMEKPPVTREYIAGIVGNERFRFIESGTMKHTLLGYCLLRKTTPKSGRRASNQYSPIM